MVSLPANIGGDKNFIPVAEGVGKGSLYGIIVAAGEVGEENCNLSGRNCDTRYFNKEGISQELLANFYDVLYSWTHRLVAT